MAEVQARPFGVQFQEAISYLKGKLPEASIAWDDLAGPVHGKVFTVAGATTSDLARDLQGAIVDARSKGQTITAFRKDFDRIVQEKGWTYRGKRGWRTAVIFETNMRSANMAGQWKQQLANQDRRPFLKYSTAGDARVRQQHRAWNGLVLPITDPFWATHYPPNGWGCRCDALAYSQADLDEKGLQVSPAPEIKTRNVVTRDGEIKDQVPVGIDPGWDHNVGQSWIAPELALGGKLARLPRELRGLVVDKTITPAFQTVLNERWKSFRTAATAGSQKPGAQVLGFLDSATLDAVEAAAPDLQLRSSAIAAMEDKAATLTTGIKASAAVDWIDELPENLRNYQAVLLDKTTQSLVIVPQAKLPSGRLGTITLKPNVATKYGSALTAEDVGSATPADLNDANRYQLLVGKVR